MTFTRDLDDFEQRLLRFTQAINENLEAILDILDKEEVPAPVCDRLMNVVIGLQEYINTAGDGICDDLENHIKNQYQGVKWRGYLKVEEGGVINFPPDLLNQLGWKAGDMLQYSLNDDKSIRIEKFPMQQG
jgi:hypothetical protein